MRKPFPHHLVKKHVVLFGKSAFWFLIGIVLGLFFTVSFGLIVFRQLYGTTIYPGVYINSINVGGKTEKEVERYLTTQNEFIEKSTFTLVYGDQIATVSAKDLHAGYNAPLLAQQAYSIGRSSYLLSDITLIVNAYINGINLPPSFTYSDRIISTASTPIAQTVNVDPVDALFNFQNGKVTAFKPSSDGTMLDVDQAKKDITDKIPLLITEGQAQQITIQLHTKTIHPQVTTAQANNLGITELIGTGTSLFQHSIASRIYNVELAASRISGTLVAPGDTFSFAKAVGDVSSLTGYQQAYVIQNGKTVLGDGGGVCQVSTTLFRAALNAGMPIVERHGHAYRVGYYEEDSPPGIDATVYVPSVDFKFKNDTSHYILIQSVVDPNVLRLTFYLYGTNDGRKVAMTTPVVTNVTPPLPTVYTDDPTLPVGTLKQVDFAASGAHISFSRTVTKGGKVIIADTYNTDYQPWAAAYLRGTKQ
ncbi:MAG: VanW family protein [Patescibacteria group bacterium]|nr:VanW family protein [Patescibacteria group bacterium]MDE2589213.1 VanW family protein [Patescibacteria group bacterium]